MSTSYTTKNWWQRTLTPTIQKYLIDPIKQYGFKDAFLKGKQASYTDSNSDYVNNVLSELASTGVDTSALSSLPQTALEDLFNQYWEEDKKALKTVHTFDYDRFASDYNAMQNALSSRPEAPDYEQFWNEALADANAESDRALAELAGITKQREDSFNEELRNLASGYNTARSGILSSQYQQNAQLMDTMASQLDKQNRNALEAGASAGLRLAGNINTLLSTQNKQSQLSLDTANQLAQMMVSQRNAEASIRGQYGDYMTQNFNTRQDIKNSAFDRASKYADKKYEVANESYVNNLTQYDKANANNPLWEYSDNFAKSKYNKTGG